MAYVWQMHPDFNTSQIQTPINRKFKDIYDMKEELGKGGFGTVRRCVLKGQRREFAVKINNTPDKKAAQIEEALNCDRISQRANRHVVNFFDCITEGDIVYNFLELASGGDLSDLLTKKEFFTPDEAACAIYQILNGVNHMHLAGLLHRDLKPANILVEGKNSQLYKVTDYGLCCLRQQAGGQYNRHDHGRAGTPGYMSPEVLQGHNYDTDCDVWSCGVILYNLLAGYLPFWEDDQNVTQNKIIQIDFEYPNPEWDGLDSAINMINRMLAPLVANPPKVIRESYQMLSTHAFFLSGKTLTDRQLERTGTEDVYKKYLARRNLKLQILRAHWDTDPIPTPPASPERKGGASPSPLPSPVASPAGSPSHRPTATPPAHTTPPAHPTPPTASPQQPSPGAPTTPGGRGAHPPRRSSTTTAPKSPKPSAPTTRKSF